MISIYNKSSHIMVSVRIQSVCFLQMCITIGMVKSHSKKKAKTEAPEVAKFREYIRLRTVHPGLLKTPALFLLCP